MIVRPLMSCVLGALSVFTPAAASELRPPQQAAAAVPDGVEAHRDLAYVAGGHARQKLDLYLPAKRDAPLPLLIWVHGGGWQSGSKDQCPPLRQGFVARGYAVASIGYRLSGDAVFPAQIEDCKAAIRWLRAHAKDYGLDPRSFGVWGSSAGGHLVALLGTSGGDEAFEKGGHLDASSRVQAVCDWFGPTDLVRMDEHAIPGARLRHDSPSSPEARLLGGKPSEKRAEAARANPIAFVTPDDPPFLIVHGDQDPLVPLHQSELLYEALAKAGVGVRLHVIKGAAHGQGFAGRAIDEMVRDFFDRCLRKSPADAISKEATRTESVASGLPAGGRRAAASDARFARILAREDANRDGRVTREEFRGPPALFNRLDLNGDGVLTKEDFTPAPSAPEQDETAARRELLERLVRVRLTRWQGEGRFPGACASFVLADGLHGKVAAGFADVDRDVPMTTQHRLMSGSAGKTYVAALALDLVGDGKLDLDRKLASWLGETDWFARLPNAGDITLRMLLNHTSGVPEHVRDRRFVAALKASPDRTWTPDELVAFVLDAEPLFPAGEGWSYADTNYILVGMVLEKVTGRPFYESVRKRFLVPLGLADTVPATERRLAHLAQGHLPEPNPFGLPSRILVDGEMVIQPQMEWTGGGFAWTTADLAAWGKALYEGKAIDARLVEQMVAGAVPAGRAPFRYGLGVMVYETSLGPAWGHSGWFPGYLTVLRYYPGHRLSVAFQVNGDDLRKLGAIEPYADRIASVLVSEIATLPSGRLEIRIIAAGEGKLRWGVDGKETASRAELEAWLRQRATPDARRRPVAIVGDAGVRYGDVTSLVDLLLDLGFEELSFGK